MSSINSASSYSTWANYASVISAQKTQASSVVDNLFNKLDTQQQGFIDKNELQAALTANSNTTSANGTTAPTANVDNIFSAMDSDGDGKITKSELSNSLQSVFENIDNLAAKMRVHGHHGNADQGLTQDQLTQMSQDTSDPKRAALMASIAQNFTVADTNGDGKVSRDEAMAYAKATGQDMGAPQGANTTSAPVPAGSTPTSAADSTTTASASTTPASTDPADTNGDGTVSAQEAMNYLLSQLAITSNNIIGNNGSSNTSSLTDTTSTASATDTSKSALDSNISRQILQLVKTYGLGSSVAANNSASTLAQDLSATA